MPSAELGFFIAVNCRGTILSGSSGLYLACTFKAINTVIESVMRFFIYFFNKPDKPDRYGVLYTRARARTCVKRYYIHLVLSTANAINIWLIWLVQ